MTPQDAITQIQTILTDATNQIVNVVGQITETPPAPSIDLTPIITEVQDLLTKLQALVPQ